MKLVVQLPALNEEKTVEQTLAAIPASLPHIDEIAVVVVDDGSTDRTAELARRAGAIVIRHERNRGVGAAFRTGLAVASELRADILVTIDADGQFDPAAIEQLIRPIQTGEADFVTASRFLDPSMTPKMPWGKKMGNHLIARWVSAMAKTRYRDVSCGFRAYGRNAFLRLVLLGDFTYTHEVFLNLAFAGVPIKEVPTSVRGTREHGRSRVAGNLWHYGWRAAMIILKTYRDYRPLRFFSFLALVLFLIGAAFLGFLLSVKLQTGLLTPHKWAGFTGAAIWAASLGLLLIGVVAEMLDRIRIAVDETLFRVRRLEYEFHDDPRPSGGDGEVPRT